MNEEQVTDALARFFAEGHRIVFWNDPDSEFEESLSSIDLDGVTLLRVDELPALAVKIRLNREEPEGRFLLYSASDVPAPADDWLLDMRLYGKTFRADRASIILADLGLSEQSLRDHLKARNKFLASSARLAKLKKFVEPNDQALTLDQKMITVLVKADHPDFANILISLFHGGDGLDETPGPWDEIEKYSLSEAFWSLAESSFGYRETSPSLRNLLIRLMVSDLAYAASSELPAALAHLKLPKKLSANVSVCLAQWRDSHARSDSYDRLSREVADALKLQEHLSSFDVEDLLEVKTFETVEKYLAVCLRDRVTETDSTIDAAAVKAIALRRQDSYWADPSRGAGDHSRIALNEVYEALVAAANLFELRAQYGAGFEYSSASEMFAAYADELYLFDRLYRDFVEAADMAEAQGWDVLKSLRGRVEDLYVNWYLGKLSLKWGQFVEGGLIDTWRLDGIRNQQRFFNAKVESALAGDASRVFVVISDALRYEAAKELTDEINGKFRFHAEIEPMLGVLPSYTALGMAALLPHQKISYSDKGDVLVDGASSAAPNRGNILAGVKGVAVKADDLKEMKKEEGRAFVKPHNVIYIYHNVIDAIGDSHATEGQTFSAVRRAVRELADLVKMIVNNLNGSTIFITADHGFLFQESALEASDKNALTDKPLGTILAKKRYLFGRGLPDNDKAYHGLTANTAGADGEMEFWVPKGNNRFHFVGGSRFVHGGAMLQEIVVPVVAVREKEGSAAAKTRTKYVGVTVLGQNHKITTNRWRVEFLQTEKVTDRVKPVTLDIAVYEDETPVTDVQRITFESESDNFEERKQRVFLSVQRRSYEKSKKHYLVLRNAETGIEEGRVEVIINIAFMDEF